MMRLLPFTFLLLPALALADVKPVSTRLNNKCMSYAMCSSQSAASECVNGDNEVIVHEIGRYAHFTFYSTESTATNYSCDIITNKLGYDNAVTTDQVNTTSITDEAPVYTMAVLLHKFWVTCPTLADNVVHINVDICTE